MQPSRVLIAGVFLLAGVSNVMAASSVDLSVVGKITPTACTPSFPGSNVVDYGKISAQDLKPRETTPLPDATLKLRVDCAATALIAVKATDNRLGTGYNKSIPSQPLLSGFGLGLASNDAKIGGYMLKMRDALADSIAGEPIESRDAQTWFDAWDSIWQPGWMRSIKAAAGPSIAPKPLQTLEADLRFEAWIAPSRDLPITEEVQIDGNATLDIVYL